MMEESSQKKQTTVLESETASHFKLVDNLRETLRSSKLKLQFRRLVKKIAHPRNERTNEAEAQTKIQKSTEEENARRSAEENTKLMEENARKLAEENARELAKTNAWLTAQLEEKKALLDKKREPCDCLVHVSVWDQLSNSTVSLDVKRSDTIKEVKAKILHKRGRHKDLRPSSFYMTQPERGVGCLLGDERTVASCDIESGSRLQLTFRLSCQSQIAVRVSTMRGESIALLRSSGHDTVGDLKLIIQEETGIRAGRQHLVFDGRKLDQDARELGYYDIRDGSTICLGQSTFADDVVRVRVANVTETKRITLRLDRYDTIGYVKRRIRCEKLMPLEGDGSFGLVFRGNFLDEDRTVGYYGIEGESTLYVVSRIV